MQAEKSKLTKRSLTSYQIWMAVERGKLKASHSELSPKELMAELGRRWKLVSDADKAQYVEKAAQLKAQRQAAIDAEAAAPPPPPLNGLAQPAAGAEEAGAEEAGAEEPKKKKKKEEEEKKKKKKKKKKKDKEREK